MVGVTRTLLVCPPPPTLRTSLSPASSLLGLRSARSPGRISCPLTSSTGRLLPTVGLLLWNIFRLPSPSRSPSSLLLDLTARTYWRRVSGSSVILPSPVSGKLEDAFDTHFSVDTNPDPPLFDHRDYHLTVCGRWTRFGYRSSTAACISAAWTHSSLSTRGRHLTLIC
jgi:hypothetical protein